MEQDRDLKTLERRAFRALFDDGLWDVLLASVLAMFAIAPLLSSSLGDFWSSFVFLPFWVVVYLTIRCVRRRVLAPRLGFALPGPARKRRLVVFASAMVVVNLVALVLGAICAFQTPTAGWRWAAGLGWALLVFFSVAAYFLNMRRLFLYGVILAAASITGEWLWREGQVTHHGFPVMFGTVAGVIALVGLIRFFSLLRRHSRIPDEPLLPINHE